MSLQFYAGYIISSLKPWELTEEIRHICVNYYDLQKHKRIFNKIQKLGLREALTIPTDCMILVDSGAFPAFKSGVSIVKEHLMDFYKTILRIDSEFIHLVNLDVIDSEEESLRNYRYFVKNNIPVMPVVHHPHEPCPEYYDFPYMGVGGLVPVVRTHKGKRSAFQYLQELNVVLDIPIHVFGLGSTLLPVLERIGVASADSISWRRCASIGAVQLPTRQVHISGREANKWGRGVKPEEVERFIDPSPWTLSQLRDSFVDRAGFNLWIIEKTLQGSWPDVKSRWLSLLPENS